MLYPNPVVGKLIGELYNTVVSIKIFDNADEFRVEIAGRFAGTVVDDVLYIWKTVSHEGDCRRFKVDITQLTGYDFSGCSLLTDMQKYGAHISASSARSLVFLNEISGPKRPTLVRKRERPRVSETNGLHVGEFPLMPVAAGE